MEIIVKKSQYEIERGKPQPSFYHGMIQADLGILLYKISAGKFRILSELSLEIEGKECIPDLSLYRKEDLVIDYSNDIEIMTQMPLCTIDISTSKQMLSDLIQRKNQFLKSGVKSHWLVLIELKSIYVFDDKGEYEAYVKDEKLIDKVLGIELDLKQLFKNKKK